ncbi:hypothetical protein [Paenibacillus zanthoxyli]|uniref:hypothetical protein n=1 Tax=Paenibacillus zanthoxyli TaxID=369399 RepID=UPI0004701A43|nr:hypothetical protein [Paenibacillus zanthoxyli]
MKSKYSLFILIIGLVLLTACSPKASIETENEDNYALPYNYAQIINSNISYLKFILNQNVEINEIKNISKGYSFAFDNSSVYNYLTPNMKIILEKINHDMATEAIESVSLLYNVTGKVLEISRSDSFGDRWEKIKYMGLLDVIEEIDPNKSASSTNDLTLFNILQNPQEVVEKNKLEAVNNYLKGINEKLQLINEQISNLL